MRKTYLFSDKKMNVTAKIAARREALRIGGVFFIISCLWIFFSDNLLYFLFPDANRITQLQTIKGLVFTAVLSFIICKMVVRAYNIWSKMNQALKLESLKYKNLFNQANDGIVILDKAFKVFDCNSKALNAFTADKTEILGKQAINFIAEFPFNNKKEVEAYHSLLYKIKENKELIFLWNFRSTLSDKLISYEISSNHILLENEVMYQVIVRDNTQKLKANQALKESEEQLKLLVEHTPVIFWISDENGKLSYVSPNIKEFNGYSEEEFCDFSKDSGLNDLLHPFDSLKVSNAFENLVKTGQKVDVEHRYYSKYKKWIWYRTLATLQKDANNNPIVFGLSLDVTERRNYAKKIQEAMTNAEEKERHRLASELHDGVSPVLSALKLYIETANHTSNQDVKAEIQDRIMECIGELSQSIRSISNNISPHILQNYGLKQALESSINRAEEVCDFSISLRCEPLGRFTNTIEATMYRVVNELLNNTRKHANAGEVKIILEKLHNDLYLSYRDNGQGMDLHLLKDANTGMGLFNIKSRVNHLNGDFMLKSSPGNGIEVQVRLPYNEQTENTKTNITN